MTYLGFWNLRHLSDGSDDDRKKAIETVFKRSMCDYFLFCELTTACTIPLAQNLTYRRESRSQLCYGCLDHNLVDHPLDGQHFVPVKTDAYKQAGFKGGSTFSNLADRALAFVGAVNGVDVFVIHAPSGGAKNGPAAKAISYVACSLNEEYGANPWLVVGDLNVEPDTLKQAPVGINLAPLIKRPFEPTFIGKRKNKEYDYVLSNITNGVYVQRLRTSQRGHQSDHYPIIVNF